jgi:hypothetical protein
MTRAQASASGDREIGRQRRFGPTVAAFVVGLPLAAVVLWLIHHQPDGSLARRYVSHPVENVEVMLFCCALGALLAKLGSLVVEKAAFWQKLVPGWDGDTVPASDAARLLADFEQRPGWARSTFLGRRVGAVLDFLTSRGSATELDDQLRSLADADGLGLENSYSLIRFITWAMPILGFLGTVLGITAAIANVTPEQLEKSLSAVTDGLALAFDATALALALTMVVMFLTFVVERLEQGLLESVDRWVERQLAHRFERLGGVQGDMVAVVRQQSQATIAATEKLVETQAAIWAKALEAANRRQGELEADFRKQLGAALEAALERTLDAHSRRLAALEQQLAGPATALVDKLGALTKLADRMAAQADALARLQEGDKQLIRMQQELQHSLAMVADAGAFQQAVHSLTAAIHLLTAQAGPLARRPGAAA